MQKQYVNVWLDSGIEGMINTQFIADELLNHKSTLIHSAPTSLLYSCNDLEYKEGIVIIVSTGKTS
jgi:hypothetical protein